jgi:hypothetical protein
VKYYVDLLFDSATPVTKLHKLSSSLNIETSSAGQYETTNSTYSYYREAVASLALLAGAECSTASRWSRPNFEKLHIPILERDRFMHESFAAADCWYRGLLGLIKASSCYNLVLLIHALTHVLIIHLLPLCCSGLNQEENLLQIRFSFIYLP